MNERVAADLGGLVVHGRESASPTWWGTLAFMLIEGTGFALAVAVYLYLYALAPEWPLRAPQPDLLPGTVVTVILLASLVPNYLIAKWAQRQDLHKVRLGAIVMAVFGLLPMIARAFEFMAVHVSWDTNAYGSIVWMLLGLHATHLVTDFIDTAVLAGLMFTRHGNNRRRFGDIEDNAMYWNFVVVTWLPLYGCLYWVPRL